MKKIILVLILFIPLSLYASGGMEKLTEDDRVEIIDKFMEADEIVVYAFWSGSSKNDYKDKEPNLIIKDLNQIKTVIYSISFADVPVAECGFDYTLILKKSNKLLVETPIKYNFKCNNVSFYWKEEYFVSGIKNKFVIQDIFRNIQNE